MSSPISSPAARLEFLPPSPGSWMADRTHSDRPRCRYIQEMTTEYTDGFRAGFRHYGALLDTIEFGYVHGFPFLCPRPIASPPEPKGPPPRWLFALLIRLHPELHRRIRRAEVVFEQRVWLEDVREFYEDWQPRMRATLLALQRVEVPKLTDAELVDHLNEVRATTLASFVHHFRINPAYLVSIGDFLVHAQGWTGATRTEILALLEGASPVSREGADLLRAVAKVLGSSPELAMRVRDDLDASAVVEALRTADGELGQTARAWLDVVGHRIFTGFDLGERTGLELPNVLLASLRAAMDGRIRSADPAQLAARTAALRARVPAEDQATFDQMLGDAILTYGVRDAHSSGFEMWTMGISRVALLECGRRLVERGQIHEREHVLELRHAEVVGALLGTVAVDADELAGYAAYRGSITIDEVPATLGPAAIPPPPAEWLPPAAARLARAIAAYLGGMNDEGQERSQPALVRGVAASGGKHIGTARLVLEPDDFDRLGPGDVLIARLTTPAYNVVLPLLGAVVTDRGGILSHPAIVAREYGIPGVVGTRTATTMIRDGAIVEVDGDAGIVKVLR